MLHLFVKKPQTTKDTSIESKQGILMCSTKKNAK